MGYLIDMTVDTSHSIITGGDGYPANQRESDIILAHLKGQLGLMSVSAYYPAFYQNNQKVGTGGYLRIIRLKKIWAEGTFAVLKREHKLNKIQKRGQNSQNKRIPSRFFYA